MREGGSPFIDKEREVAMFQNLLVPSFWKLPVSSSTFQPVLDLLGWKGPEASSPSRSF
jgi:hypothetical protein